MNLNYYVKIIHSLIYLFMSNFLHFFFFCLSIFFPETWCVELKAVPSSHHIFSLPINSSCMPPHKTPSKNHSLDKSPQVAGGWLKSKWNPRASDRGTPSGCLYRPQTMRRCEAWESSLWMSRTRSRMVGTWSSLWWLKPGRWASPQTPVAFTYSIFSLAHLMVKIPACSRHMFGRPLGVLGSSCPLSQLSSSCVAISCKLFNLLANYLYIYIDLWSACVTSYYIYI